MRFVCSLISVFEFDYKPRTSVKHFIFIFQTWDTLTPRTPSAPEEASKTEEGHMKNDLFTKKTRSFIYGRQFKACQGMLDFDYACAREQPSVAAIIDPFSSAPRKDFYWGSKQIFIPSKSAVC